MPWVRFTADFDFKPRVAVTLSFKVGERKLVTTPCGRAAIAAGKAELIKKEDKHGSR